MLRSCPTRLLIAASILVLASACGQSGLVDARDESLDIECSVPTSEIHRGALRGVIPALTDPELAYWGDGDTDYLTPSDRIVGLMVGGEPVAIPLNIFWWHEIVNLNDGQGPIAVTHCPLTGSTLAFDRKAVGGAEFDVSGLLYENNLMMFDRSDGSESLWPQMARGARCGPKDGKPLPMAPVVEMTWEGWRDLHPTSKVVTSETGHIRDYTEYPYDDYDDIGNDYTLFPGSLQIDGRRPPKERALGIPDGAGGTVYPFGELTDAGWTAAVHGSTSDGDYVVFWDRTVQGAAAFRPVADGRMLTFRAESGRIFDDQTDSEWQVDGHSTKGPLAGMSLEPVAEAFVAFWFAWPVFYPDLELWTAP